MASIQKRGKKYCVIYRIYDDEGKAQQKWETYDTEAAAKKRKLEAKKPTKIAEAKKAVTKKEKMKNKAYIGIGGIIYGWKKRSRNKRC